MYTNNLKAVRKAKGKTQQEIAEFIGITQNAYSYWESGKVKINSDSISRLAELYGVSIDFLLGRKYKMRNPPEKWQDSLLEDYYNGDENLKKYMEGKYGDIVFVETQPSPGTDKDESQEDVFTWHRNGEEGQAKLSKEVYDAIVQMIKATSENPKDI